MRKDVRKSLDEKMQVKLPEALKKDAVLEKLGGSEKIVEINEPARKKHNIKRLVPVAASLLVVAGLLGVYFGSPLGRAERTEKIPPATSGQVVRSDDYGEIYGKFEALQKEYKRNQIADGIRDVGNGILNFGNADEEKPKAEAGGDMLGELPYYNVQAHGETNAQEQGVDEGDILKTDGRYIYVINQQRALNIIDCADGKMTPVSAVRFDESFFACEMYISEKYAVIIGVTRDSETEISDPSYSPFPAKDLMYGYASGRATVMSYDISDKAAPKKADEYSQQGEFKFSRMIGSKLYCVSTYYVNLASKNLKDDCIPEAVYNGNAKKLPADSISVIKETESPSYALITVYDAEKGGEPSVEAVLGGCTELYATTKNIFLTECFYKESAVTKIYKFDYTENGVAYKCAGAVGGRIHNQFSMSSQGEYLRVATTDDTVVEVLAGTTGSPELKENLVSITEPTNTLYILDAELKEVGKADNLANGERIKSARFVGNTAYIVTFRQTDPLFVIDTSDPENPKVQSELKLPGFSEYLHPIADGYLIGVGRDGTEAGINLDCKVSLFDVRDPYNPKESSKQTVGSGKSYVDCGVSYNHKLFINLPGGEFAVPFSYDDYASKTGLVSRALYIRYAVSDGELRETARYALDGEFCALAATYIGNTFYALSQNDRGEYSLASFSLTTNEQTEKINL